MLKVSMLAVAIAGFVSAQALAVPIQTTGAGSAVTTVDRSATFDAVTTGTDLSSYTEGGLRIAVNQIAFTGYDPTAGNGGFSGGFHYPSGGASNDTSISTTDSLKIFGVEFNVGNGWNSSTTDLEWRIFDNSILVGSGTVAIAAGSVVGFSDAIGFDELLIADRRFQGDVNAVALDNLRVQLNGGGSVIPEPATLALLGIGLAGLGFGRRKRAS